MVDAATRRSTAACPTVTISHGLSAMAALQDIGVVPGVFAETRLITVVCQMAAGSDAPAAVATGADDNN
jgi:hypothetical protein